MMYDREDSLRSVPQDMTRLQLGRPDEGDRTPRRHVDAALEGHGIDASRADALAAEDEKELGWKVINDHCDASREQLVRTNVRLVIGMVQHYSGRGVATMELIRQRTIGLRRAVASFDPAQGVRFSERAGWWIKQAMRRAVFQATNPFSPA